MLQSMGLQSQTRLSDRAMNNEGSKLHSLLKYFHIMMKQTSSNYLLSKLYMFKLDLEKEEKPEIKLPTSVGSSKNQESSRKTSASVLLAIPKPLTVWITTNCGKFSKRWEYQTAWPASWEICMQVKKLQLELDMEQQNVSKSGKEYVKAVYCHPAYLTYLRHVKCWAGWSTSWNQDCQKKYQWPQICRWYHPYGRKE